MDKLEILYWNMLNKSVQIIKSISEKNGIDKDFADLCQREKDRIDEYKKENKPRYKSVKLDDIPEDILYMWITCMDISKGSDYKQAVVFPKLVRSVELFSNDDVKKVLKGDELYEFFQMHNAYVYNFESICDDWVPGKPVDSWWKHSFEGNKGGLEGIGERPKTGERHKN